MDTTIYADPQYTDPQTAFAKGVPGGVLTISTCALRANYALLQRLAAPAEVAAVVKADAYGLGAVPVSRALYEAGCRSFFVAQLTEALKLQPWLSANASIFVLNGLQQGEEAACAGVGIIPVLNSFGQARRWAEASASRPLPALLQVDSGMSRLGFSCAEVQRLLAAPEITRRLRLLYLMSELASADEPGHAANRFQLASFNVIARRFPGLPHCFANSGGIFLGRKYAGALARPGIALYGGAPQAGSANPMTPVVRLDVQVIQTRQVPAGMGIGYGWSCLSRSDMRLAVIAAGYADGIPRSLSNTGAAYYRGVRLPIAGRVCMDSTTIDVSALPPDTLKEGDTVEILGPSQSVDALATAACTTSYEVLTRLGQRYRRVYV